MKRNLLVSGAVLCFSVAARGQADFVNWENPHVHPLDLSSDGSTLLAVNTPDNRLELFNLTAGAPVHVRSIPVGLDPVSVRVRTSTEAWVVNHVSDSVSIVNLVTGNVVATISTEDEPADVVFAGEPQRAFVTCSQANRVLVFDPANLLAPPVQIVIQGEDPRGMAVSPDGSTVYVAVFESGNRTTILGGGSTMNNAFPPNAVNDPLGPYGGVNPPPNDGSSFSPALHPDNPSPPGVGLIVKKNASGQWMDDNDGNWTDLVTGPQAALSGRPVGWDLLDHDVAIIDAESLVVSYVTNVMNICMSLAVNPASGEVTVVGTDATNEIRFEPNINGRFLRVELGIIDPATGAVTAVVDLNPHLSYAGPTVPQTVRALSIGDPRGVAWNAIGSRGYVTGMGSNNLVVINAAGTRAGIHSTIEVGQGPTGVVLDESRDRLYVLNKFESSLSVVDTVSEAEVLRVPFFDPSPPAIKLGRPHQYNTHKSSGLGHVSCASCHVDSRMDRLAWDLGDPAGAMRPFNQNCAPLSSCQPWHPMKGPMTTQTMQDIIGKEPHHWRGDRNGIEEFNGAFMSLLGNDTDLTSEEMQEYEDFLATITFPPNPFRKRDNTLPNSLPLTGHFTTGRFGPAGQPLPAGSAVRGLNIYRTVLLDGFRCVSCHSLPTGLGTNLFFQQNPAQFVPFPQGPDGEFHHQIVSVDGSTNVSLKTPQLRNLYEKVGFEATQSQNLAGFGFLHDGSVDSITRFLSQPLFNVQNNQQIADLVALMLAFSGSDLPLGNPDNPGELPGPPSNDTHAAVGVQSTVTNGGDMGPGQQALIDQMLALARSGRVGLVVKGTQGSEQRGYEYVQLSPGVFRFQSDRAQESHSELELLAIAEPGSELTYTLVPAGTQNRIGIDRDRDGFLDRDEIDECSDPADPQSLPPQCKTCSPPSPPVTEDFVSKVRFISFSPFDLEFPPIAGELSAIRVKLLSLHHPVPPYTGGPSIPFTAFEGQVRWVGPPVEYVESVASAIPFFASTLQCSPFYGDWSAFPVLHVTGSEIVPSSVYAVQRVIEGCDISIEGNFSTQLQLPTARWGDVDAPYNPPSKSAQPDVMDVAALVNKFRNMPGALIKAKALLAGSNSFGTITSMGVDFGFSHIAVCVDAFQGRSYPYVISACP